MYGATTDKKKLKSSREKLNILYSKIPSTKGCLEHIAKPESDGGCGAWCCKTQNPQVLYSEFLNSWNHVSHSWTDEQIAVLIENCLRKYLFPNKDKGCVFLDKSKNLCSQHETRPFNCRTYGIIPEEEFKPRYERLKVIYPDARDQCNLVSTNNGHKVTTEDMDRWWLELNGIEYGIGIKKELVNDQPQGSYRTYHDHILIHVLGDAGMENLSQLRKTGQPQEKEHTIIRVMDALRKFKEKKSANTEGNDSSTKSEDTSK